MSENNESNPNQNKSVPTLGYNSDGVMGSTNTNEGTPSIMLNNLEEITLDKVAIFSNKNLYADGYGKVKVGYNIISNKNLEFWLQQKDIRLATPEEVMGAFN